jgi:hypothetical protein
MTARAEGIAQRQSGYREGGRVMEREDFTKRERLVFGVMWLSVWFALFAFVEWVVSHA